jgi:hypothetical protein
VTFNTASDPSTTTNAWVTETVPSSGSWVTESVPT